MKQIFAAAIVVIGIISQSSAVPVSETNQTNESTLIDGRHYSNVFAMSHSPAYFSDFERLLPNCPRPMTRWYLNNSPLDRSVYGTSNGTDVFCGCITHQNAPTPNGFVLC
ncbi:hypothetical protein D9613_000129 [Agrocybe pediades]|uniref:Uncharacterized protein n=1 Tax=Agrocybe pediades TaxID=84607 RepID=A0A8H4R175_9AGAR|nr:hypothetical protein D9613_000129 [Agrocybe pediades]